MKSFEFEDNIYLVIRQNIKKYRLAKNMTSAELAECVELSHEFIRALESNSPKFTLSVKTLYKISVVLGVRVDKLFAKPTD